MTVTISLSEPELEQCRIEAFGQGRKSANEKNTRVYGENTLFEVLYRGVRGEVAIAKLTGYERTRKRRDLTDGGIDFRFRGVPADVKTANRRVAHPRLLLDSPEHERMAARLGYLYLLCRVVSDSEIEFLGVISGERAIDKDSGQWENRPNCGRRWAVTAQLSDPEDFLRWLRDGEADVNIKPWEE